MAWVFAALHPAPYQGDVETIFILPVVEYPAYPRPHTVTKSWSLMPSNGLILSILMSMTIWKLKVNFFLERAEDMIKRYPYSIDSDCYREF